MMNKLYQLAKSATMFGLLWATCWLGTGCSADPAPAGAGSTTADSAATGADAGTSAGAADGASASGSDANADTAKADAAKAPCKPWETAADWNCPADTHCGYDELDIIACLPDGTHGVAEDCSDGMGCKIGLCTQSANGDSACSPYCTTASQCDSDSCNKITGKKYSVCDVATYTACNALAPKCPTGQSCYLLGGAGFVCVKAGAKAAGEGCETNTECAPGLTCAGAAATSTGLCRKLCSKTAKPNGCDDPSTNCSSLNGSVGYCEE